MGYKKLCKALAFATVISIPLQVKASEWDGWREGIQVIPVVSGFGNSTITGTSTGLGPVTWGDLIRILDAKLPENDINELLKMNNKNKLPLIVTKNEVANISKALIELNNQSFLNRTGVNHLNKIIGSIAPTKNYFTMTEFNEVVHIITTSTVRNGMLGHVVTGKLNGIDYNKKIGDFDVIINNRLQKVKYPLNLSTPWEMKNSTYEMIIENGVVLGLEPTTDFSYGFVKNTQGGLEVNGNPINNLKETKVKSGDYVEYITNENEEVIITNNLKSPSTDIVKEVQVNKIETINGKTYMANSKFVTLEGIPISVKDIKSNDVIFKFNDGTIIVTSNSKEENFSLIGDTLVINGVMYDSNSILVTDGTFLTKINDWEYGKQISKGEIIKDLFDTPIMIKVPQVYYKTFVTKGENNEIEFISNSILPKVEENKLYKSLDDKEFYELEIVENEIVKSNKVKPTITEVDKLYANSITLGKERFTVENNTTVISKEDGAIKTLTYDKLRETYKDKIQSGYMKIKALNDGKDINMLYVEYVVKQGLTESNSLPKSNYYKVDKIERENGVTLVTLSTGDKTAKFTYNKHLSKLYEGLEVKVIFDKDGMIESIK